MGGFLDRLGRLAARRHWYVIGVWVLIAIAVVVCVRASGGHTFDNFKILARESQTAVDLLESRFPEQSGTSATVVFHARSGTLDTAQAEAGIAASVAREEAPPAA